MKASLIGTVFLFACIFGQNSSGNQGNVKLVQNMTPCFSDADCQNRIGPISQCKDNSCMCPEGGQWRDCVVDESVVVIANQGRQINPGSLIGLSCESNQECKVPHAYCKKHENKSGKCQCEKGFIPSHDKIACLKIAENLNDFCFEDRQCFMKLKHSICSQARKCECQDNYHVAIHRCWKTVEYAEPCENKYECWKIGAHCNETTKTCLCDINRIINNRGTFCLDLVENKERCFEDIQCGINSICISGHCNCKNGYHYLSSANKCIKDKAYGDRCEDGECYENMGLETELNSLTCNHTRYCDCAEGFKFMEDKCFKNSNSSSKIALHPMSLISVILFLFLL